jgi:hypothetical protein
MQYFLTRSVLLATLVLTACGGGNDSTYSVSIPSATAGAYLVATGSASDPSAGYYFVSDDGSAVLALEDSTSAKITSLYTKAASSSWVSVPAATSDTTISILDKQSLTPSVSTLAALAGTYTAVVSSSESTTFTISSDGVVTAGSSTCALNGTVTATTPAGLFKMTIATSGCSGINGTLTGWAFGSSERGAEAFRMLLKGSDGFVDLWTYAAGA